MNQKIKMNRKSRKVWTNAAKAIKRAGRIFASALLVSGLMLAAPKARADETAKPQKAGVGVKVGAGYSIFEEEPRALVLVNAQVPLPLKATLGGSLGVSSSTDGSAKWEETFLNLNIPIAGPVFMDIYGYNSRHFFIPNLSVGADVGVSVGRGTIIAAYEHVFDFDNDLAFGVFKMDAIPKLLSLNVTGGYTWTGKFWSVGGGFTLTPGGGVPELGVHVFGLLDKESLFALDTIATLGYSF